MLLLQELSELNAPRNASETVPQSLWRDCRVLLLLQELSKGLSFEPNASDIASGTVTESLAWRGRLFLFEELFRGLSSESSSQHGTCRYLWQVPWSRPTVH